MFLAGPCRFAALRGRLFERRAQDHSIADTCTSKFAVREIDHWN